MSVTKGLRTIKHRLKPYVAVVLQRARSNRATCAGDPTGHVGVCGDTRRALERLFDEDVGRTDALTGLDLADWRVGWEATPDA